MVEVHSGDSVTLIQEDSTIERKVFFASVKAPGFGNQSTDSEPWGFEAREFVRKVTVGKKVKVNMEFKREIEVKNGPNAGQKKTMEFATLFLKSNDQNVSEQLILKGFARTNVSKFAEENSKFAEALMKAEKVATDKKIGIHSKKEANQYRFIDTTQNSKASKQIE